MSRSEGFLRLSWRSLVRFGICFALHTRRNHVPHSFFTPPFWLWLGSSLCSSTPTISSIAFLVGSLFALICFLSTQYSNIPPIHSFIHSFVQILIPSLARPVQLLVHLNACIILLQIRRHPLPPSSRTRKQTLQASPPLLIPLPTASSALRTKPPWPR